MRLKENARGVTADGNAVDRLFLFSVRKYENEKGRTSGKRQAKRLLSVKRESLYTEGHEQRTQAAYAFS